MKASRIQRKCQADNSLAEDVLTATALEARLFGHAGFPEAADALAYDAVQRILAVCLLTPHSTSAFWCIVLCSLIWPGMLLEVKSS